MAAQLFANNADSTLSASVTAIGTSIQVQAGDGAKFPATSGGNWFVITAAIVVSGIEIAVEIMKVIARVGDVFTVVRAQEGTTAIALPVNARISLRLTAAALNNLVSNFDLIYATLGRQYPRPRVLNGNMEVAQDGTSFTAPALGTTTLDGWIYSGVAGSAVCNVTQSASVPSGYPLNYSLRATVTTSQASVSSGDARSFVQKFEGYRVADLVGVTFIVQFWVISSKTGIHCMALRNTAVDRSFVSEFTINSANTWELKSVLVGGGLPSSGTWNFTNGVGLVLSFAALCGSTYHTASGIWQPGNYLATANQVNVFDTVGNIFGITGVSIGPGIVPTSTEFLPYPNNLLDCQRYYKKFGAGVLPVNASGTDFYIPLDYGVPMRATPTVSHNLTDGSYSTAGSGNTWGMLKAGFSFATKTGTVAVVGYSVPGLSGLYTNGGTWSVAPNTISLSGDRSISLAARL